MNDTAIGECGHNSAHTEMKARACDRRVLDLKQYARMSREFLREHGASSYVLACLDQLELAALDGVGKR